MGTGAQNATLLSVCVGQPGLLEWRERRLRSAIDKRPVSGPVAARSLGLEGDRQADPEVHGGPWKAVYIYPSEHYPGWRRELGREELHHGTFGENLVSAGLDESTVAVGDVLRIGTAELQVTHPRMPCAKLIAKLRRDDAAKVMLERGCTGFYVRVRREGTLEAGDPIERVQSDSQAVSIAELLDLYTKKSEDPDLLERVLSLPALPEDWRNQLRSRRS